MKIAIQDKSLGYGDPVTVVVNDECNHAGAYEDELDYGYANANIGDWVDDWHLSRICDRDDCDWSEMIESDDEN